MDHGQNTIASDTIDLLETRLRRIEYVIFGRHPTSALSDATQSAALRLMNLERTLDDLIKASKVVQDLLKLHAHYPDFFHAPEVHEMPSLLESASKASIVLAAASSYPLAASSLTSILDTPIPSSSSSAALIESKSNINEIEALQKSQMADITNLKQRSASLLQRWYSIDILQTGEWWADIEDRMEHIDWMTRRSSTEFQND